MILEIGRTACGDDLSPGQTPLSVHPQQLPVRVGVMPEDLYADGLQRPVSLGLAVPDGISSFSHCRCSTTRRRVHAERPPPKLDSAIWRKQEASSPSVGAGRPEATGLSE